jgi:S-disulfanyl-L-cysteine oxidoreductase SoxD
VPAVTIRRSSIPRKKKGPELIGKRFADEWQGKPLNSLLETVLLTMPNDGSAVLSEEETADVIAYILQANGHPEGTADLKYAAGKDIVIGK